MIAIELILPFTFFVLPISYVFFEKYIQWRQECKFLKEIMWHEEKLKSYHEKNKEYFYHKRCVPTIDDAHFGRTGKWIDNIKRDFYSKREKFKSKNICAIWQNFCDRNNIYSHYPNSVSKLKTIPETTLNSDEEDDESFVFYF